MRETYHLSKMGGIRRLGLVLAVAGCFAFTVGCKKAATSEGTTAAGPSSEGEPRSSGPSRAEIACHLHSCAPTYFCNREKGVCEQLPCIESRDCPYGCKCDFSKNVCQ
ncbi:MAG: hypothetical protein OEN21_15375 [Myxococcales bacterium]|nr:hypothetical protein [Myxococcales bacterium]